MSDVYRQGGWKVTERVSWDGSVILIFDEYDIPVEVIHKNLLLVSALVIIIDVKEKVAWEREGVYALTWLQGNAPDSGAWHAESTAGKAMVS